MYTNITGSPVVPYVSWANVHANFYDIQTVPAAVWRNSPSLALDFEITRFSVIICAIIFFAFFGFADEARRNYRLAYVSVAKRVGLSTGSFSATGTWTANGSHPGGSYNGRSATMPVFIIQQTEKQRDSMASFSSHISLPDYGGALDDVKKAPMSPTTTVSGSISRESLPRSPVDVDNVPLPSLPEAVADASTTSRYASDASHVI